MAVEEKPQIAPPSIGDHVICVDPTGKEHNALVTSVFQGAQVNAPSLNLVYVSDDESATDQYGRQLASRVTSTVHESNQYAHGNYWKHP